MNGTDNSSGYRKFVNFINHYLDRLNPAYYQGSLADETTELRTYVDSSGQIIYEQPDGSWVDSSGRKVDLEDIMPSDEKDALESGEPYQPLIQTPLGTGEFSIGGTRGQSIADALSTITETYGDDSPISHVSEFWEEQGNVTKKLSKAIAYQQFLDRVRSDNLTDEEKESEYWKNFSVEGWTPTKEQFELSPEFLGYKEGVFDDVIGASLPSQLDIKQTLMSHYSPEMGLETKGMSKIPGAISSSGYGQGMAYNPFQKLRKEAALGQFAENIESMTDRYKSRTSANLDKLLSKIYGMGDLDFNIG